SLCAPALVSPDPYQYVADAMLGKASYQPPSVRLPGEFGVINDALGTPMPPSLYGPLWMAIVAAVTSAAAGLLGKILLLRWFGVVMLLALLAGLRVLALPGRVLAVTAMNPAVAFLYVANAHNDLFCVTCVVWAAAIVGRSRALAVAAIVAAALVKLPFALLGIPALSHVAPASHRWTLAAITVASAVALSWLGGGRAYAAALSLNHPYTTAFDAAAVVATICALALLASTLASNRRLATGVWLMPLMASYPRPWYGLWGIPYALRSRRVLGYLLVFMPFASALTDTMFVQFWTIYFVVPLVAVLSVTHRLSSAKAVPT
ncbi:MAG: hypothetical protein JO263_07605, partial [Candidatus Eremiobacteraeota bacterium]|nr:hypothetical protein [Candidatus Eremiobacteraeota bacterium]